MGEGADARLRMLPRGVDMPEARRSSISAEP